MGIHLTNIKLCSCKHPHNLSVPQSAASVNMINLDHNNDNYNYNDTNAKIMTVMKKLLQH